MKDEQQGWRDCPIGQIHEMVDGIRSARRRRQIRRVSAVLSVFLVLAVMAVVASQQMGQATELTCSHVQRLYGDYEQGRLATNQSQRVAAHLEKCPHCRKRYDERRQESRGGAKPGALVAMHLR